MHNDVSWRQNTQSFCKIDEILQASIVERDMSVQDNGVLFLNALIPVDISIE